MSDPLSKAFRLIVRSGEAHLDQPLGSEPLTIGRDPGSTVVLDHPKVSRQHAILRLTGAGLELEDLDSSNGTDLNDLPVLGVVRVGVGDAIRIGPYELTIRVAGDVATPVPPPVIARPAAVASPAAPPPALGSPRATAAAAAAARQGIVTQFVLMAGALIVGGVLVWLTLRDEPAVREPVPAPGDEAGIDVAPAPEAPLTPTAAPTPAPAPHPTEGVAEPAVAPPPVVVDQAAVFGLAVAEHRFLDADRTLERLGRPAPLAQKLEDALATHAHTIVLEVVDRVSRDGSEKTIAWLRERLDEFPDGSPHRRGLTRTLIALHDGALTGRSGVARVERPAEEEEPPVRPEPPAGSAPAREGAVMTSAALAAARGQVDAAEARLAERDLVAAEAQFKEVAAQVGDRPAGSRSLELARRCSRGLRMIGHYRAAYGALQAAFKAGAVTLTSKFPAGEGRTLELLDVTPEGLVFDGAGGRFVLDWRAAPLATMKALIKRSTLEPAGLVAAAAVLRAGGSADDAAQLLVRAFKADATLKPAIDRELADARKLPEVPEGGFTLSGEKWLSPVEVARIDQASLIEGCAKKLASDVAAERDAAFTKLHELGDVARADLHRGLLMARIAVYEKLKADRGWAALAAVEAQRKELDQRRLSALELIQDAKRYPYPYRVPEASQEDAAAYAETQPIVDRRVAAVREIWGAAKSAPIPPQILPLIARLQEIRAGIKKAAFGELPDDAEWLFNLPQGQVLTLRNFAVDAKDRKLLSDSLVALEWNQASPRGSLAEEAKQVAITNEYRMMLGRRALKIHAPLVVAAHDHCEDMVRFGFFAHESPVKGKESIADRVRLAGADPVGMSENLAINSSPEGAHRGWCHSSGHHRNLVGSGWWLMGAGHVGDKWCQVFSGSDSGRVPR